MKKIYIFICLFFVFTSNINANESEDLIEQTIQAMIQNVEDYTLNALGEQTQLTGIEELKALRIRTLDLQSKIQAMEPLPMTPKYLSMIQEVLTSIDVNIQKLDLSLDRDIENLIEDLQKIELQITRINHIQPQENKILSIYEGNPVSCSQIEEFLKGKYSLFAWNSCSADTNELISYVISVKDQEYNYELLHIKFDEGIQSLHSIESGTGVTQTTILEKNITLRNIPEYAQYIASLRTQTTINIPETQNPQVSQENTSSGETISQPPTPITPSSQALEGGFSENYTGQKVGCENAQTLANQRYGWAAWNRCEVKDNILTIYVLGIVDESKQSYIYEKNIINFDTSIKEIIFLESGVGINKENLIEKNRDLRTKY